MIYRGSKLWFLALLGLFFLCSISNYGQSIRVLYPNGGEVLEQGAMREVRWQATGLTGNIRLVLLKNGARIGVIVDNLPSTATSYDWEVGQYTGGTESGATTYKIRVKEIRGIADESDGNFTISARGTSSRSAVLRVTAPRAGLKWQKGKSHTIRWIGIGNMDDHVKISLYKSPNELKKVIINSTSNANSGGTFEGSYTLPINWGNGFPAGTYFIRVETLDGQVADDSQPFEATPIPAVRGEARGVPEIDLELTRIKYDSGKLCAEVKSIGKAYSGNLTFFVRTHQLRQRYTVSAEIRKDGGKRLEIETMANLGLTNHCGAPFDVVLDPDDEIRERDENNNTIRGQWLPTMAEGADIHFPVCMHFYGGSVGRLTFRTRKARINWSDVGVYLPNEDPYTKGSSMRMKLDFAITNCGCGDRTLNFSVRYFKVSPNPGRLGYIVERVTKTIGWLVSGEPGEEQGATYHIYLDDVALMPQTIDFLCPGWHSKRFELTLE